MDRNIILSFLDSGIGESLISMGLCVVLSYQPPHNITAATTNHGHHQHTVPPRPLTHRDNTHIKRVERASSDAEHSWVMQTRGPAEETTNTAANISNGINIISDSV